MKALEDVSKDLVLLIVSTAGVRMRWPVLIDSGHQLRICMCDECRGSIAILLLMLRPHLRTAHLILVIHRSGAVWALYTLILVVHLVDIAVALIRIRIRTVSYTHLTLPTKRIV